MVNTSSSDVLQYFWEPAEIPFVRVRTTFHSCLPYAAHFHSALSIGVMLEGQTQLTTAEENCTISHGSLIIIAPGVVHSCNSIGNFPRSYHMLYLDPEWCLSILGYKGEYGGIVGTRLVHAPQLCASLCSCLAGVQHQGVETVPAQRGDSVAGEPGAVTVETVRDLLSCESRALVAVLHTIVATCCEVREVDPFSHSPSAQRAEASPSCLFHDSSRQIPYEQRISFARHAFTEQNEDRISMGSVAQSVGLSRERFSRLFRKKTGLPPGQYSHCLRLERACRLMLSGQSIAEAAQATGYADQSHFHRMFVKYFAATPYQYRQYQKGR